MIRNFSYLPPSPPPQRVVKKKIVWPSLLTFKNIMAQVTGVALYVELQKAPTTFCSNGLLQNSCGVVYKTVLGKIGIQIRWQRFLRHSRTLAGSNVAQLGERLVLQLGRYDLLVTNLPLREPFRPIQLTISLNVLYLFPAMAYSREEVGQDNEVEAGILLKIKHLHAIHRRS